MNQSFIYKSSLFFFNTFLITWTFWLGAIYSSWNQHIQYLLFPCILGGISGPSIATFMIFTQSKNKRLWFNFYQRMHFSNIKIGYLCAMLFFMPCLVLFAIAISLLFGQSTNQFTLSLSSPDQALNGQAFVSILAIIGLSCSLEEIGWRGYSIESLNSKFNLWNTSLIFATMWCLWHCPLFFIKNGFFQKEFLNLGMAHVVNYFICLFAITFLINWIYVKNNRSILIAILSHMMINFSLVIFKTQPYTKFIIMILLVIVSVIIVIKNKKIFFEK